MDTYLSCDCPSCVGSWAEVGASVGAWLDDIDSVPFAHETFWTDRVGELREEETR